MENNQSHSTILENLGVTYSGKELTQFTLSPDNDHAAVGGKQGLYLIDLNDPWDIKNKFNNKPLKQADFTILRWSKDPTLLSSGSNNLVHLWKCDNDRWTILTSIKAHRRKLSDMSWSELDPGFLCTCAPDSSINVWDVRCPSIEKTGVKKIKSQGAPATIVRWNRFDATKIASAHHGAVYIWDVRIISNPVTKVLAETSEINSFDWSYTNKDVFLTAPLSNKFKLWSVETPNDSIGGGSMSQTIQQASFTPFGLGVAVLYKNTNLIQFLNIADIATSNQPTLVETFGSPIGNANLFLFREGTIKGLQEYQLVTWSSVDTRIQLRTVEHWHIQACAYQSPIAQNNNPEPLIPIEDSSTPVISKIMSMEEEFDTLQPISGVIIEKMDKQERALYVSFQTSLKLKITFPSLYPFGAAPAFTILENNTQFPSEKIKEDVINTSTHYVSTKFENCLEPCFKLIMSKYVFLPNSNSSSPPKEEKRTNRSSPAAAIERKLKELGEGYETYLVQQGDILSAIALKNGMEKTELRRINDIHHSGELLPGRVLIVKKKLPVEYPVLDNLPRTSSLLPQHRNSFGEQSRYIMSPLLLQHRGYSMELEDLLDMPLPKEDIWIPTLTRLESNPTLTGEQPSDMVETTPWGRPRTQSLPSSHILTPNFSGPVTLHPESEPPLFRNPPQSDLTDIAMNTIAPGAKDNRVLMIPNEKKKIIKSKIQYIQLEPEFSYVSGVMTLTHDQFFFEPNLDDPQVQQHGVQAFNVAIELSEITEAITIKPTDEKVDANIMAYILIATQRNGKSSPSNHSFFYFMTDKERSRRICQKLDIWSSEKQEQELVDYLNLENSIPSEQNHIIKAAIDKLHQSIPKGKEKSNDPSGNPSTFREWEEDTGIGQMLGTSQLINQSHFEQLKHVLPVRFRDYNWKLLFTNTIDGSSLITFYSKLTNSGPTILLIEDTDGYVFGGFASEDWEVHSGFFGTGESFVFTVKPKFACYKWTHANDFFMNATKQYIGMGGGVSGRFALYLDSELYWGTSETSNTFLNRRLSSTEEFSCTVLEVWGFTYEGT